jgi:hypothetical protein
MHNWNLDISTHSLCFAMNLVLLSGNLRFPTAKKSWLTARRRLHDHLTWPLLTWSRQVKSTRGQIRSTRKARLRLPLWLMKNMADRLGRMWASFDPFGSRPCLLTLSVGLSLSLSRPQYQDAFNGFLTKNQHIQDLGSLPAARSIHVRGRFWKTGSTGTLKNVTGNFPVFLKLYLKPTRLSVALWPPLHKNLKIICCATGPGTSPATMVDSLDHC